MVRRLISTAALALCASVLPAALAAATFSADFTGATLRIDYVHTGTAAEEHLALARARIEGPWSGSRTQLLDPTNLGKHLVEVVDLATNTVLYSRGFASIFGEWETTGPALAGEWGAIEEAVRVPEPRRPFHLRVRKRQADQSFREIGAFVIDPKSRFVDRPELPDPALREVIASGDPAVKADLLVLGDGYTEAERGKFDADVDRLVGALFAHQPFAARRADFNVRALFTPAAESGVTRPRHGVFRDSPLGARYNTFDSERYVLSLEDRRWRDAAAGTPYDFVLMLLNERMYGGGGIFGLYSTAAADNAFAPYLVVHEFAHHLAGLADEYYTSDVAYQPGAPVEPWEPNVTALLDPERLKWRDLVSPATPIPTPWSKETFEKESAVIQKRRRELRASGAPEEEMEALFRAERELLTRMLGAEPHAGRIGAFEGANYLAEGSYRPAADCIMFTRDEVGFCAVCRRAIERVIDLYTH